MADAKKMHRAADALRSDPMFAHLDEDAQLEAARAQLAVEGGAADPIEIGLTVHIARTPREALPSQQGPAVTSILSRIIDVVPIHHLTLADVLDCSRALVTAYINGRAPERLYPENRAALKEYLLSIIRQLSLIASEL